MYETSISSETVSSLDDEYSYFPLTFNPVSIRGGYYNNGQYAGIFAFARTSGTSGFDYSWRASLTLFCRVYFFKEKFRKGKEVITNF